MLSSSLSGLFLIGDMKLPSKNNPLTILSLGGLGYIILHVSQRYIRWLLSPLRRQGVPGPQNLSFWWGAFFTIRSEPFMEPHLRWIHSLECGWDIPLLHYTQQLGSSSLLLLDKEIVKQVLSAPYGKSTRRFGKDVRFLRNILGLGLVTAQGVTWKKHRKIIQPAFYTESIKDTLGKTVPPLTQSLVACWKQAGNQREIDVSSHLSSLTLDVIGRVAFSHEFGALKSVQRWALEEERQEQNRDQLRHEQLDDPFVQAFTNSFRPTFAGSLAFFLGQPWMSRWFSPTTKRTTRALNSAVDQVISNAKVNVFAEKESTKNDRTKSLLDLLLGAANETLNDVELRDEAKTFIFAGHETTSTWCYMAIYALVTYPSIQEKVYQDIVRFCNDADNTITLETIEKMEYFSAFLQEVLRLHSPVGMFTRITQFQENFAGYKIPKGARLVISPYLLHRHPKYWDDPLEFQPERWLNPCEEFSKRIRFVFLPFSGGGRNCIGYRFATVEAKLILAELIRSFVFELAPSQKDTKFTFSNMVVLRTKPRLKIVVTSRE